MDSFSINAKFEKFSPTGEFVAGWAKVATVDGAEVVDWDGDVTSIEDLTVAAHEFILNERVAKVMHKGDRIGDIVESVLIDDDFAASHGIVHKKRGWWIKMQVHDANIRKRVVKREFTGFSIGGRGVRKRID